MHERRAGGALPAEVDAEAHRRPVPAPSGSERRPTVPTVSTMATVELFQVQNAAQVHSRNVDETATSLALPQAAFPLQGHQEPLFGRLPPAQTSLSFTSRTTRTSPLPRHLPLRRWRQQRRAHFYLGRERNRELIALPSFTVFQLLMTRMLMHFN